MNKSYKILIMSKTAPILFTILLLFAFARCQEEDSPPTPIELAATVTNVSEFGRRDGAIDLIVTGGRPDYSFIWSNNDTTEDLRGVAAGTYYVNVFDSQNQTASDTFKITQPVPDSLTVAVNFTHPSEAGAEDGTITVEVGGGCPPYSFLWNTGATTQNLDGLPAGTYICTVTDSIGQVAADSVKLTDMVTDIDGNSYTIQKIGNQTWMGENLRVTHAPDGTPIESFTYNNDTVYEIKYGRLYTWIAAMNGSTKEGAQGICPDGWHIPTDDDYKQLEMALGMTQAEANMTNIWRGAPVGNLLSAGGGSGYEAQMSGRRSSNGTYSLMGTMEYMWTSSEYSSSMAWRRCLQNGDPRVGRWNTFPKSYGFSVRCIKNEN
jgi:uncharacterized protein (TIGR02145 family)